MELNSTFICVFSILVFIVSGTSAGRSQYNANGYKISSSTSIEVISVPVQLGNGLFWDKETQKLYFADLLGRMAYRYDPYNSRTTSVSLGTIRVQEGTLLDLVPNAGNLFTYSRFQRNINVELRGLTFPNDIAFSLDNECLYLAESDLRVIYVFDYDIRKGDISKQRILFDFRSYNISGFPDGLAIDTENKLWVACFGGGQVIRIDPITSKLLEIVKVPSLQVTSLAFGGRYLNELFVTSANIEQTPEQRRQYPYPGRTFRITGLGAKGLPGERVVL